MSLRLTPLSTVLKTLANLPDSICWRWCRLPLEQKERLPIMRWLKRKPMIWGERACRSDFPNHPLLYRRSTFLSESTDQNDLVNDLSTNNASPSKKILSRTIESFIRHEAPASITPHHPFISCPLPLSLKYRNRTSKIQWRFMRF